MNRTLVEWRTPHELAVDACNGNKLGTCVSYLDRELDGLLFAARSLSCEMDHHIFCGIVLFHGLNLFNGYSWNGD